MKLCNDVRVNPMVKTGPRPKIDGVKDEILRLLVRNNEVYGRGLGFREIYRALRDKPPQRRASSFSTLKRCLDELLRERFIVRDPETKRYHANLDTFGFFDKIDTKRIIEEANVYGGGRLCHPDLEIVEEGFLIPEEGIRPFLQTDVFAVADLTGKAALGTLHVIVHDPVLTPEEQKMLTSNTQTRVSGNQGTRHEDLLPVMLTIEKRLNPQASLVQWLRDILELAKHMKLITQDHLTNLSKEELDRIWDSIFSGVDTILLTKLLYPRRLLEWLKTPKGEGFLKMVLANVK